mgnify:CR=1 FL=1
MKLPKYPLASSDKMMTFEFVSEGNKGLIHKLVKYQPTNLKGLYNLAFGDKDLETGKIDDKVTKVSEMKNLIKSSLMRHRNTNQDFSHK